MAKILYGVAGEGSGHSSRAKEIAGYLQKKKHKIKILTYNKGLKNLSPFFDTEEIFGLRFDYKDGGVQYMSTFITNLLKSDQAIKSINKTLKIIDEFKPNIVFTDFEPISCIAGNFKALPVISIDNQHRLINTAIEYPKKYQNEANLAKAVVRAMIFKAKQYLVTSFFQEKILKNNTFLFNPILRNEIIQAKTSENNHLLVYLTSENYDLIEILKKIKQKFIVYGFDKNEKDNNLVFKKPSEKIFIKDLASSRGVVANAGFTLITEALYLKKPYLALPVKKQFEQVLNAIYLEKLGYGKYWDELNKERIESFLFNLDFYKKNLEKYKRQDNRNIFNHIDKIINSISKK